MNLRYIYSVLLVLLSCVLALGQTGINTSEVSPRAALHVDSQGEHKGLLVPQLTTAQRDAIKVSVKDDDGLIIFNTDEECINYWSALEGEWKSACGQVGKAEFRVIASSVVVKGQYLNALPLDEENYITVTVEVTKAGRLGLSAVSHPDNGYYFSVSSDYVGVGQVELKLVGMGIPTQYGSDAFSFIVNGIVGGNNGTFKVAVGNSAIQPDFTMDCTSVQVEGVYKMDEELRGVQQIQVKVTAPMTAKGAVYKIKTEVVDGISFEGEGELIGGEQVITLKGKGVPYTSTDKRIRIQTNSTATGAVCYATVRIAANKKKIIVYGGAQDNVSIGYKPSNVRKMLDDTTNYGLLANSKVVIDGGQEIVTGASSFNANDLIRTFQLATPEAYDIVVLEKGVTSFTDAAAEALVRYLQRGGVVLLFNEHAGVLKTILSALTSSNDITINTVNRAAAVYRFSNENDLVLNGSFGDIRGMYWGEDDSPTLRLTNVISSDFIIYSGATDASKPIAELPDEQEPGEGVDPGNSSSPEVNNQGEEGITALRHGSYSFVWVGDGRFNNATNSTSISPFNTQNNSPVEKEGYGHTIKRPVVNAVFTANLFEWAIKQAETKGINTRVK